VAGFHGRRSSPCGLDVGTCEITEEAERFGFRLCPALKAVLRKGAARNVNALLKLYRHAHAAGVRQLLSSQRATHLIHMESALVGSMLKGRAHH
jgi:hypothetical protein